MKPNTKFAAAAAAMLFLSACAQFPVPAYESSFENVKALKDAGGGAVTVGKVVAGGKQANDKAISVRGNTVKSPVNNSFADYLRDALVGELRRAELLKDGASVKIDASVIENDLVAESATGRGVLSVQFTVTSGGQTKMSKVISARTDWESSFVGAVAIPRAVQAYPKLVETLLMNLYRDSEFVAAIKSPASP